MIEKNFKVCALIGSITDILLIVLTYAFEIEIHILMQNMLWNVVAVMNTNDTTVNS